MNLISTLQEASGHPIDDLKKVMSKDKRVNAVFQKTLDVNNIENKAEFLQTLKFFLLNNRNVIEFVEGRNYIKALDKGELKKLRELRPNDLKQKDIDRLLAFVADLFREHANVERSGLTPSTRKELVDWANANGRYFDLSTATRRELMSVPNIRPTRPTLLYRGLLFNSYDLKERKRYDGQLEIGKGLQFLRSVREGSRIVDLDWDRASSWSTSPEVAMRFARFRAEQSNFDATMNWLNRKSHIDGDLGFVISTLAQPEDVLIDMNRLVTNAHLKHGSEGEFILAPGKYRCRVSVKMTKAGEVDPLSSSETDETLNSAVESVRELSRTWKPDDFEGMRTQGWKSVEVDRALQNGEFDKVIQMAQRSTKEKALESYAELKAFYEKHIAPITSESLESLQADPKVGPVVEWIVEFKKFMESNERHLAFKSPQNTRGNVKVKDLTPQQFRETAYTNVHNALKAATTGGRYTDRSIGNTMSTLHRGLNGKTVPDLHRKGRKDQEEVANQILDTFLKKAEIDIPADHDEKVKLVSNAILGAERNAWLISKLHSWRESLDDATKMASEPSEEAK